MTQIENTMVIDGAWPAENGFSPWDHFPDEIEDYLLETDQACSMIAEYMEGGDWADLYAALKPEFKDKIFKRYTDRHGKKLADNYDRWWIENHEGQEVAWREVV